MQTVRLIGIGVLLAACGSLKTMSDLETDRCDAGIRHDTKTCNEAVHSGQYTNSAWQYREEHARITARCPGPRNAGARDELAACVSRLEAVELAYDPGAPARREAERQRVAATSADPEYAELARQWLRALDGAKLTCPYAESAPLYRRRCYDFKQDMSMTAASIERFLVAQGYDTRDLQLLRLAPHDPDVVR